MDFTNLSVKLSLGITAVVALFASGCASTAPSARFTEPTSARIASRDSAKVTVAPTSGVSMQNFECERLASEIESALNIEKTRHPDAGPAKSYEVEVRVTRYQKGSAFARAMLIGLGQIHINGDVAIYEDPGHLKVGEFALKKTFAWGGLYGGFTSMDDVEKGFAKGVAEALVGRGKAGSKNASTGPVGTAPALASAGK